MAGHRLERITEDIKREMTDIMRDLKDPRIKGLLSIVRVEVTNDLSYAKIYVSAMEGMEQAKTAVAGFKSASGYVRRELANRMHLRHVPELIFIATDSIAYGVQMSHQIDELAKKEGEMDED